MKIRRRKKGHAVIEAASLSDILFFLMLFFLMISTMASPEAIRILLPNASTGKAIPKHPVSVVIDNKLNWYVDGRPADEYTIRTELSSEQKKYNNEITVVLKADKDISVEQLIKVVDIVNQLKIPMVVATARGGK
jgi:biopolymer transport protein ExbD